MLLRPDAQRLLEEVVSALLFLLFANVAQTERVSDVESLHLMNSYDVDMYDLPDNISTGGDGSRQKKEAFKRVFVAPIKSHDGAPTTSGRRLSESSTGSASAFTYTVLLRPSSALPLSQFTKKEGGPPKTKSTISPSRYAAALSNVESTARASPSSSPPLSLGRPLLGDVSSNRTAAVQSLTSPPQQPPQPPSLFVAHPVTATVILVLVLAMILVTVIGNCMVCLAICMVRKLKQQPANLLLVSLAVADFSVGLLVMPIALINLLEQRWFLGELVCRFWTSADLTLCTASILNLCVISVDRYLAVTRTLRYAAVRSRARMLLYVCVVWVSALLVSVTPLIFFPSRSTLDHNCQVSQNPVYQIYATIISFYAPCLIMVVVYARMWRAAKRIQKRDRSAFNYSSVRPSLQSGNARRQRDSSESSATLISPRGTSRNTYRSNSDSSHNTYNKQNSNKVNPSAKANNISNNNSGSSGGNSNSNNNNKSSLTPRRLSSFMFGWRKSVDASKVVAQSLDANSNVPLLTDRRRGSTVMMIIPEMTAIDDNSANQVTDLINAPDITLKNDKTDQNTNDNSGNSSSAKQSPTWPAAGRLRSSGSASGIGGIGGSTATSNGVACVEVDNSRYSMHPRKKFRHMFSSPLLGSGGMSNTASVTNTVASAVVHRIQRPSTLLNAVRVPLLASRVSQDKGEDKARKTLGVIMSVFIICWLPFFILALVKPQYPPYSIPTWLDLVVLWLGYSNSMLNPLIYCKYNREFRMPFREMLCCRFRTLQVVMRNESFYTKFGPPQIVAELRNLDCYDSNGASASNGYSGFGPPGPPPTITSSSHATIATGTASTVGSAGGGSGKRNSSPCTIELMRADRSMSKTSSQPSQITLSKNPSS